MSFDLSTTNILLAGAVIALFAAFVFILMKLQPTAENKQSQEPRTRIDKETQLPLPLQAPRNLPPSPKPVENSTIGSKPFAAPTTAPKPTSTENQTRFSVPAAQPPPRIESREAPKQNKPTPTPNRVELTPTRKDCIHFYGYLHSLPKNTPIPDECFGCVKIVDCLINPNSTGSSLNGNHNSNHNHNSKKRGWL